MHPCICSPRSYAIDFLFEDPFKFFLDMPLNSPLIGLELPSGEFITIIFQSQLEIAHHWFWMRISAICTALRAAPLRKLSETTHKLIPLGMEISSRIRPTNVSSLPSAS